MIVASSAVNDASFEIATSPSATSTSMLRYKPSISFSNKPDWTSSTLNVPLNSVWVSPVILTKSPFLISMNLDNLIKSSKLLSTINTNKENFFVRFLNSFSHFVWG